MVVTANEVKKRGVSLFRELFKKFDEIIISNRGKKEFVVIDYERYKKFREYELERAYEEVMEDVKEGRYKVVSAKEHIENLKKELGIDV
jgi:PHD/YefM family antitoxin component YafN of YafNO toxin-antitoxin module